MQTLVRVALGLVAVAISAAVFFASMKFYSSTTPDVAVQWVWTAYAGVSAAVKILFPYCLVAWAAPRGWRALGWVAVVACVLFDVLGVSGFVTLTRGAMVEAKKSDASAYYETRDEIGRLRKLADEYSKSRPTETINAELKAARATAKDCDERGNAYRDSCKRVFALESEAATAGERDKRELRWTEAKAKLDRLEIPNEAKSNPLVAGLRHLPWSLIGVRDPDFFIDLFLRMLTIIISEAVAPLCGFFALHGVSSRLYTSADRTENASQTRQRRRPRGPPGDLLETLRKIRAGELLGEGIAISGAGIVASNRALAKARGAGTSKLRRELQELIESGKVRATPGPGGTYIELN